MTFFDAIKSLAQDNAVALPLYDLPTPGNPGLPVERDEAGVPIAWRLFPFSVVYITRQGQTAKGQFTPEAADQIIDYFQSKGTKIPLDSRHFTYALAEKYGVDETAIVNLLNSEEATFGFASLEKRDDGLWVVEAEYHPLAYRLMQEGTLRYFSPALRGLVDGRLRITSVTFTNQPATDGLFSLAASAEAPLPYDGVDSLAASLDGILPPKTKRSKPQKKDPKKMNKLLTALASLLAMDSIALSDDGNVDDDVVTKLTDLDTELRANREVRKGLVDTLALDDQAQPPSILAALKGLADKATQADDLKTRVDALELSAETARRAAVVDKGFKSGKLTKAMVESDWGKAQDSVALEAYLQTAPVIVAAGKAIDRTKLPSPDSVALSAEDEAVCKRLGIDPDAFLAEKKAEAKAAAKLAN